MECFVDGERNSQTLVFLHGWPDSEALWQQQVDVLSVSFRCVRFRLPGFGGSEALLPRFGYTIEDLAAMLERQLRSDVLRQADERVTLIAHDWGSPVAFALQRRLSNVSRMVIFDVGPLSSRASLRSAAAMVAAGVAYQWWLAGAFLVARVVPFVGGAIGDLLCSGIARVLKPWDGGRKSALSCYLYLQMHLDFWQQLFRFRAAGKPRRGPRNPNVPCLFLSGRRGLGFLFRRWADHLRARQDSDALALDAGHWLMLERAAEVNIVLQQWLAQPAGGKARRLSSF